MNVNFNTMLAALANNTGPIIQLVTAIAYVMGIWFIYSSIQGLKEIGTAQNAQSQTHGSMGGLIMKFIMGLLLLYLPSTIDVAVWTLWGHSAFGSGSSVMAYQAPGSTDPYGPMKAGAIAIVRVVGYVSFVRGFVILSNSTGHGAQQGTVAKGVTHVLGGILAINIVETINIISNTLGITV